MTEQEHYSLRWNNHQNHILRAFDALLQTKSLVDVTLVCAETSIRAHKVVLSACSPFFQNVFAENPCKHPVIVLKDFPGWVVQAVVDFMYRGEISVPQKRLETLIQVGESLQIRGLVEHRVAAAAAAAAAAASATSANTAIANNLTHTLDDTNNAYSDDERTHLSNDSAEQQFDDAPSNLVKTVAAQEQQQQQQQSSNGVTAQNGTKHPRLLNSNPFTDNSAADTSPATNVTTAPNTTQLSTTTTTIASATASEPATPPPAATATTTTTTTNHINENREQTCTSPMPRRKQARPRRRSGEGGPQDYSSKSTSPLPIASNDENTDEATDTSSNKDGGCSDNGQSPNEPRKFLAVAAAAAAAAVAANKRQCDTILGHSNKQQQQSPPPSSIGANILDTDKVVDCTVAAIQQSIIRDKLNANENDISDNELEDDDHDMDDDEDDEEMNDAGVHDDMRIDDMEHDDDDLDDEEHDAELDEKLSALEEGRRKLLLREHGMHRPPFFCDDMEDDGESSVADEHDVDLDDADGPENLCIKNTRGANSDGVSNNNNNKDNNTSSNNSNSNNNNRIGLSLKDIRHLNRPPSSHLSRQSLFPGFPVPHHHHHHHSHSHSHHNQHPKVEHLVRESRRDEQMQQQHQQKPDQQQRQSQLQQAAAAAAAVAAAAAASGIPPPPPPPPHNSQAFLDAHSENMKREALESRLENENAAYMDQMDLSLAAAAAAAAAAHHHHHHNAAGLHHPNSRHHELENNLHKEFSASSPMSLQSHFNPREGPPHPPSPLQFPGMSSMTLTPPHHMFGLDSPLSLFPPGMDPGKLYNPLMEMPDPRGIHPHSHGPYLKKKNKLSRPKGQHSAPRGGPPRSWTNAELTEALHHVWNKKMTTSQASRLFGIPYNSLLMYVRGKYGKSLNLEQLRKGCISGPPIELLTMGLGAHTNNNGSSSKSGRSNKEHKDNDDNPGGGSGGGNGGSGGGGSGRASGSNSMKRNTPSEADLLPNPNMFNPFGPGFYPDFAAGFPGLPLSMLNLLPPDRHPPSLHGLTIDEDCKSDRSKQSLEDDYPLPQPLPLSRDDRRELIQQNGQE